MRYLILGSSLRGLDSAARAAVGDGHQVALFDAERPGAPDDLAGRVVVLDPVWSPAHLDGIERIVTSPWFAETEGPLADALERDIDIITEAGYGLERLDMPVVAITGTNGKTTVTEVTTEMLRRSGVDARAAGNIGLPVSAVRPGDAEMLVLELSSYQLRFIGSLRPEAATILNIAPDHLDWHGSFEAYASAKARIFDGATDTTVVAYDPDDPLVSGIVSDLTGRLVPCSGRRIPDGGNGAVGATVTVAGSTAIAATADPSYLFDLVVAGTLADACGASREAIASVIATFAPGPHRREQVAIVGGVMWINDSKATNPHAAVAAIVAYPSVILLAGGRNKGLDLAPLAEAPGLKAMVTFGESGPEIAAMATERGGPPATVVERLDEAVAVAASMAQHGDTVLLSPGCASFDQFASYAARGEAFRALVEGLPGVAA